MNLHDSLIRGRADGNHVNLQDSLTKGQAGGPEARLVGYRQGIM